MHASLRSIKNRVCNLRMRIFAADIIQKCRVKYENQTMDEVSVSSLTLNDVEQIWEKYCNQKRQHQNKILIKSFVTKPLSEVPCGFLSHHSILTIHYESEGKEFSVNFFVKSLPKSLPQHVEYVEEYGVFKKEVNLYQQIIPKLVKFSPLKWVADCYLTKKYSLLVFEDLQSSGFEMFLNRKGILDYNHLTIGIKTLAALHASSIIYESGHKRFSNDVDLCKLLVENAYPSDPESMRCKMYKSTVETLCELIKVIPKYKNRCDILPKFRLLMMKMANFVKTSTKYRNVFCHGDLWGNNILFKYAESRNEHLNRQPTEAIFVDFQLSRYVPPALDLLTLLTITSTSEFRKKYFHEICDLYYSSLSDQLKNHSIDIGTEIERSEFDDSLNFYRVVGLMESCLFCHLTLLPHEMSTKIMSVETEFIKFMRNSRTEICLKAFETDDDYRLRMSDMLMVIVDEYVLKD